MKLAALREIRNSAGGLAYAVDDWTRLWRFLILGSDGGSYYAGERELTVENGQAALRCFRKDPARTVSIIVEVSQSGRAARNDPAIMALALGSALEEARGVSLGALSLVCRTASHLFLFLRYARQCRGFGRALRRGIGDWYRHQTPEALAYQLLKYRRRYGWTHRDVLRRCHPQTSSAGHQALFRYAVGAGAGSRAINRNGVLSNYSEVDEAPPLVESFRRLQSARSEAEVCQLLDSQPSLSWEMVPDAYLGSGRVWRALLPNLPMTALVRNLGRMQANGALDCSDARERVVASLSNVQALFAARLHPLNLLAAMHAYRGGHSRGGLVWSAQRCVLDALEGAFYLSFRNLQPCGKRTLLGLDVSGSMCAPISGLSNLSCREASAAMAMVTARLEPCCHALAFTSKLVPIELTPQTRLDKLSKTMEGMAFGATDCAQPMLWALKNRVPVDTFVVYTDSETWFGKVQPHQALRQYRDSMGIPARLVVVGMVSNGFSIADPCDPGMLDVVGFDTAAPSLISDFSRDGLALPPRRCPDLPPADARSGND